MKTPDEIKKGLETCVAEDGSCDDCPYAMEFRKDLYVCYNTKRAVMADALALIQQLEPIKALVEQYIAKYRITCSESIWQMDKPQLGAIELADKLCKLVGYMEMEDE